MLRHRMRRVLLALVLAGGLVGLQAAEARAHPVPNDDFDEATVVDTLPFTAEQDTAQATAAPDDPVPSCVSTSHTVWYTGTAPSDLSITIDTFGSDYDTTLSVWTGERGALTELACNDDAGGTLQSRVTFDAPAGEPVYLMVGSFGESPGGNLVLNIYETQFPANDDFDNATVVDTLPFTTQQDTALATSAPDDPAPSCVFTSHTVWYVGTAPSDLSITIDTFGSNYDTTLSVWTGERGALTELACNDDTGGLQSQVTFDAPAGEPVYLMVGSYGEAPGGNLVLNIYETPPPGSAA